MQFIVRYAFSLRTETDGSGEEIHEVRRPEWASEGKSIGRTIFSWYLPRRRHCRPRSDRGRRKSAQLRGDGCTDGARWTRWTRSAGCAGRELWAVGCGLGAVGWLRGGGGRPVLPPYLIDGRCVRSIPRYGVYLILLPVLPPCPCTCSVCTFGGRSREPVASCQFPDDSCQSPVISHRSYWALYGTWD